jgi:hypothetical protein
MAKDTTSAQDAEAKKRSEAAKKAAQTRKENAERDQQDDARRAAEPPHSRERPINTEKSDGHDTSKAPGTDSSKTNPPGETEADRLQTHPDAPEEQDRDELKDPSLGGTREERRDLDGPLAKVVPPGEGDDELDEVDSPAIHALNVLRRTAEVRGQVTAGEIGDVYDETGLDWQVWRATVPGV